MRSSDVALTQDTIANLLGVRRESITAAAGKLQAAGLIQYRRGSDHGPPDRPALESRVCECYATVKTELERLVPRHVPDSGRARASSGTTQRSPAGNNWLPPRTLSLGIFARMPARPSRGTGHLTTALSN